MPTSNQTTSNSPMFTFLSWNLANMAPSFEAPSNWRVDQTENVIRERVLELKPDFVFFQELPGMVPFVETHDLIPANTISHSGNIATIARKELMDDLESKAIGRFAVLTTIKSAKLSFANVHLAPGKSGDYKRLQMLSEIKHGSPAGGLVIVGDTNMRNSEEESLEPLGLFCSRPPVPTWNTKINEYYKGGRKYTAYYTRYLHCGRVQVDQAKVWDQPVEHDGKQFHLSDHFALSGRVKLKDSNDATEVQKDVR